MHKIKKIIFTNLFFLTIIFTALFFTIQCNPPSTSGNSDDTEDTDNTKAIIVTVDGLSFANTLLDPFGLENIQKSEDYLKTNLSKLDNSESIRSFTWSGDAGDTAVILQSSYTGLRKFLIDNYNEAKAKNKAFIVIGHSWGTFLSYLALSLEPQIQCDLYITLSSPLGTASGLPLTSPEGIIRKYTDDKLTEMSFDILGTNYPNTKKFYNFWANGDLVSGSLAGKIPVTLNVQDVKIDEGINDNRDIAGTYFWHKFTTLGDEVVTVTDPSYPIYLAYLISIGINDITPARNTFINQVVSQIQTASGY